MNFFKFFMGHPIFAGVLSALILLIGIISIWRLPILEYPGAMSPSVAICVQFPDTSPRAIVETATSPLEERISGVENILYMRSQTSSDSNMITTVTFGLGTDPDKAQQLVQNRMSRALPCLPDAVQHLGAATIKGSPDLTMAVHLLPLNDRYNMTYLCNYAVLNIKGRLARISSIGRVQLFDSSDYPIYVRLDPSRVVERGLTANKVVKAIRDQNVQVTADVIGSSPSVPDTDLQLSVNARGRLKTEQEFGNIVLKSSPDDAVIYLHDAARIELVVSGYDLRSLLDNKQAVAIPIFQVPGPNTLQISDNTRKTIAELREDFLESVDYRIVYDSVQFVCSSIEAIARTLLEVVALVVLMVILFLQTRRMSIIPLLTVSVSIIGMFGLMLIFGSSINAPSLFGLVLAVGIVADNAVMVMENIERNIAEGLSPRKVMYKAVCEVSSPIIAIALTPITVFVPLAFMTGLVGQFYKQFTPTIPISTVISALNSLALSPTLAVLLFKSHDTLENWLARVMNEGPGWIFHPFNRMFGVTSESYSRSMSRVVGRKAVMLGIYLALTGATALLSDKVPGSFMPMQNE